MYNVESHILCPQWRASAQLVCETKSWRSPWIRRTASLKYLSLYEPTSDVVEDVEKIVKARAFRFRWSKLPRDSVRLNGKYLERGEYWGRAVGEDALRSR